MEASPLADAASDDAGEFLYEVFVHADECRTEPGTAEELADGEPMLAQDETLVPVLAPPAGPPLRRPALRIWRADPGALLRALVDAGTLGDAAQSTRRWIRSALELSVHPAPAPLLAARREAADWLLAVSPNGEAVAIVRHRSVTLHLQADDFAAAACACALPPDRRPSLRLATWSSDSRCLCVGLSCGRLLLLQRDAAGGLAQVLRPRRFGPLRGGIAALGVRAAAGGALLIHVLRHDGCVQLLRAQAGRAIRQPSDAAAAGGGTGDEDDIDADADGADLAPAGALPSGGPPLWSDVVVLADHRVAPIGGLACCLELLPTAASARAAGGREAAEALGGSLGAFAVGGRAADGAPFLAVWEAEGVREQPAADAPEGPGAGARGARRCDGGGSRVALRVLASTVGMTDGLTSSAAVRRLGARRKAEPREPPASGEAPPETVGAPAGAEGEAGGRADGQGLVLALRASACGSRIASLCADGTLALWRWDERGGGGGEQGASLSLESAALSAPLRARAVGVGWWGGGGSALVVARADGTVAVGQLPIVGHELLSGLAQRPEPGGIAGLSDVRAGRLFLLERRRRWVRRERSAPARAGAAGPAGAAQGARAVAEAGAGLGSAGFVGSGLDWLLLLLWRLAFLLLGGRLLPIGPPCLSPPLPVDRYRLLSVRKASAQQLLHRRLEGAEWTGALTLARAYDLPTDPIYAAQWAALSAGWVQARARDGGPDGAGAALAAAALQPAPGGGADRPAGAQPLSALRVAELLDRMRCTRAALDAALGVVPPSLAEARALLAYATRRCAHALLAARAAGGAAAEPAARECSPGGEEGAELPREPGEAELRAYRLRLAAASRRLGTYAAILAARAERQAGAAGGRRRAAARAPECECEGGEEESEEESEEEEGDGLGTAPVGAERTPPSAAIAAAAERAFDARGCLAMREVELGALALHAARSGRVAELRVLWARHGAAELPCSLRLAVLRALPCTTSPAALRSLAPRLLHWARAEDAVGHGGAAEGSDDVSGGEVRAAPGPAVALPAADGVCAHVAEACAWACARARAIEATTGLVSHALATLDLVLGALARRGAGVSGARARAAADGAALEAAMAAEVAGVGGGAAGAEAARCAEAAWRALLEAQRLRCALHELALLVYAGGSAAEARADAADAAGGAGAAAPSARGADAAAGGAGSAGRLCWRLETYEALPLDARLRALARACGGRSALTRLLSDVAPALLCASGADGRRGRRPAREHVAALTRALAPVPGACAAEVRECVTRVGWLLELSRPHQTGAPRAGRGLAAVALAARAGLIPSAGAADGVAAPVAPAPAAPLLLEMADVLRVALGCAYAVSRVDSATVECLSALYEQLPSREACEAARARKRAEAAAAAAGAGDGAWADADEAEEAEAEAEREEAALQACVDALDGHLAAQELLAARGLAQPMALLLGAEGPHEQPPGAPPFDVDGALSAGGGAISGRALHALLGELVTASAREDARRAAAAGAHGGPTFDWAELLEDMLAVRARLCAAGAPPVLGLRPVLRLWAAGALQCGRCEVVLAFAQRQGAALDGEWGSGPLEPLREEEGDEEEEEEAEGTVRARREDARLTAGDLRGLLLCAVQEWVNAAPSVDHVLVGRARHCLAAFGAALAPRAGAGPQPGARARAQAEALAAEEALVQTCGAFAELLAAGPSASGAGGADGGGFHLLPLQLRLACSADERAAQLLGACDAVGAPHERADAVRALAGLLRLPKAAVCAARERLCRSALRFGDVHAAAAEALWLAAEGHALVWDACELLAGTAALAGPAAAERRAALLRHALSHAPARTLGALLAKHARHEAAARRAQLERAGCAPGAEAGGADDGAHCEPGGVGACALASCLARMVGQPDSPAADERPRGAGAEPEALPDGLRALSQAAERTRARLRAIADEADAAADAADAASLARAEARFCREAHAAFAAAALAALAHRPSSSQAERAGANLTDRSAEALAAAGDLDAAAALPAARLGALLASLVDEGEARAPPAALAAARFAAEMSSVRAALARAARARGSSGLPAHCVRLCRFALCAEYRARLAAELAASAGAGALGESLRLLREERADIGALGEAAARPGRDSESAGGGGLPTEWSLRFAHLRATVLAAAAAEAAAGAAPAGGSADCGLGSEERAALLSDARALWNGVRAELLPLLPERAHLAHEGCLRLLADCARAWPPSVDARDRADATDAALSACTSLEALCAWRAAVRRSAPSCAAGDIVALELGGAPAGCGSNEAAASPEARADGRFGAVPAVALIAVGAASYAQPEVAAAATGGDSTVGADGDPAGVDEGQLDAPALARAVVAPLLAAAGATAVELRAALPHARLLRAPSWPAAGAGGHPTAPLGRALAGRTLLELGVGDCLLTDALYEAAAVRAAVALARAEAASRAARAERKAEGGERARAEASGEWCGDDGDESAAQTVQLARALGLWACARADEEPARAAVGEGEAFKRAADALLRHVRALAAARAGPGGHEARRPAAPGGGGAAATASLCAAAAALGLPSGLAEALPLLAALSRAAPAAADLGASGEARALACDEGVPLLLRTRALGALLAGAPAGGTREAGGEAGGGACASELLPALELLSMLPAEWQRADAPWRPRGDSLVTLAHDLSLEERALLRLRQLAAAAATRAHTASLARVLHRWADAAPSAARAGEACALPLLERCAACGALDVAVGVALSAAERRESADAREEGEGGVLGAGEARQLEQLIESLWAAAPPPALAADAPDWSAARARGCAVALALALLRPAHAGAERAARLLLPAPPAGVGAPVAAAAVQAVAIDTTLARLLACAGGAAGGAPLLVRLAASAHWPALGASLAELGPHAPAVRAAVDALVGAARPVLAGELLLRAYGVPAQLRGSAAALSLLRAHLGSPAQ